MTSKLKKTLRVVLGFVVLGILAFALRYCYDTSFEGDAAIRFLEGEYTSLEEVLRADPFRGKVVYVDLWFSTCPFCLKEIRELPPVKEYFRERNVEFLYLSHQTRHPNSEQLWKNAIREHDLTGWHFMMTRAFEKTLWQTLREKDTSVRQGFPHYLIIDNTSGYRNYNAPKPSHFEELKATIESLPPGAFDE